jgi:hypothetical protein
MDKENVNTRLAIEYLAKILFGLATFIYFFFTDKHDSNPDAYHIHGFFCLPDFVFELASFLLNKSIAYIILIAFWLIAWTGLYFFCYPILDVLLSKYDSKT